MGSTSVCGLVVVLVCLWGLTSAQGASYDHEVEGKGVKFAWKVDGDTLHAKISAKTKGWVAVGFNPTKKMKDGNYIIGFVKDGKARVEDHFGNKATGHSPDEKLGGSSDVTLIAGSEDGGITTIEFTIPMDSGDKYDSALSIDGDTIVMLAHGPDRDSLKPRHKSKSKKNINLSTGAVK